ncbi:MAG: HAMP domain-containing histidine kinase [Chitinispirillaceae bacterium]|nr:HAMP domain-containing histidine kinase [Chitinispirillaceae bacterium]
MNKLLRQLLYDRSLYMFLLAVRRLRGSDVFLIVSLCCLAAYIFLTQSMLGKLQHYLTSRAELCADRIGISLPQGVHGAPGSVTRLFRIIDNTDMPTIAVDTGNVPFAWAHIAGCTSFPRAGLTKEATDPGVMECVKKRAERLRKRGVVCAIRQGGNGPVTGYLLMGRSSTIKNLTMLSIAMTALFTVFALIMYVSFHNFRLNERSNLWVALAKETAHQLGTPITALMGWVEYLRSSGDPESGKRPEEIAGEIEKICADMDSDLKRLRKISSRFSQIGSVPVLEYCDLNEVLHDCMDYYQIRLPFVKRKIEMRPHFGTIPPVRANRELLEWVFENLLKNSIDAIQQEAGRIEIRTEYNDHERMVRVYHADNGRGITWEAHKKIFAPGFTTKKRGWGLGLTLAKRIIEDYHQGRIFVHWSKKDKGTVFCVDLPVHAKAKRLKKLTV